METMMLIGMVIGHIGLLAACFLRPVSAFLLLGVGAILVNGLDVASLIGIVSLICGGIIHHHNRGGRWRKNNNE